MSELVRVRRALISVHDKAGLAAMARALAARGVEIVSTGGTARAIADSGVAVTPIEAVTGFPEMLDGRVKTLHPAIHGGLLYRRDRPEHAATAAAHGIAPIDLVCVNLYPFERTVADPAVREEAAIEQIDIGGPSMVRSAAKNFDAVTVLTSPAQYAALLAELEAHEGCTTPAFRRACATAAFERTAAYDAAIAAWMARSDGEAFPNRLRIELVRHSLLRYGENPHQAAAAYRDGGAGEASVLAAEIVAGKELSYNNILDASAALEAVEDLRRLAPDRAAACVVKHTNPCGAALGTSPREAFDRAWAGDPLAAYGGIVASSAAIDPATAEAMARGERFLEVIVAPAFDDAARAALIERWKSVRLVAVGALRDSVPTALRWRSVPGGMLAQTPDGDAEHPGAYRHSAGPTPSESMRREAAFAMTVVRHLKSNAVCITSGEALLGAGAGQMDRLAACRHAISKSGDRIGDQAVAASDAFFPFADGPQLLVDAGVRCIVHPGGSKRDQETFDLCNARGVTCLVTGSRHFRH